ncbi:MAG: right-handed parallel beta-helix repeat-containing protein [Planctomycetota bacterium]|nr:MAG: right-handed parallel beta-helix repeat-containing protein [Planctomycetota bacterium]
MVKEVTMVSRFVLINVISCMLLIGNAYARDYHISPQGDDSNPGTKAQPWQSIKKVNDTDFTAGDSILFEGGKTFAGTIRLDKNDSGTSTKKVTITSYRTGRAIINGADDSSLLAEGCDYLVIKNINFVGSGRKTGNTKKGVLISDAEGVEIDHIEVSGFQKSGLSAGGVHNIRITNVYAHDNGADGIGVGASKNRWSKNVYVGYCTAENNPGDPTNLTNHSGSGIVVGQLSNAVIEYCEAMNNGWDMPRRGNGPVGIWTWSADKVIIQFCIAHDNKSPGHDGGGFDIDGGVTNSILQYNLSYNNEGPGYFLCQYPTAPPFKNNIVRYNISQNDGTRNNRMSGIDIYAGDVGMSDCQIYNNTIYNKYGAAIAFGGLDVPGITIRNNIFIFAGELISGGSKRGRFENNIYWRVDDRDLIFDGHTSIDEWAQVTGQEKICDTVVGKYIDPKLIKPGTATLTDPTKLATLEAYKLKPDSPCIGAGLEIKDNGGRDFWGNKIPDEEKPTIGACEKP